MKEFTVIYPMFSPIQLIDENGKLVGEILLNSFNQKLKIHNEIFKIKYNGLFSRNYKIFDQNKNLVFKSDFSKNRFVYYRNEKEIFTYKNNGWFNNKLSLYKTNDLIISVESKGFFKKKYKLKINNNFNNHFIILAFLNDYISSQSS
ncbi:hypothetical protein [Epilithonimonas sp. UC225_85]|uniref:hypothetical protein n=1 Tax=Epilithonimonas sp. UC225_85 TaxID=3350167 RepID=UPI0036D2F30B